MEPIIVRCVSSVLRYQPSHTCIQPPWPTPAVYGAPGKCLIKMHLPQSLRTFPHGLFLKCCFCLSFFYLLIRYSFYDNDAHCSRIWPVCFLFWINTIQEKKRIRQMMGDKSCDLIFLLALMLWFPNFIFLKWVFPDRFEQISFYSLAEWVWFPSTFLQRRKKLIHSYLGKMFNYSDCVSWMNTFRNGADMPNSSKKNCKCRQPTCKAFFYLWWHWVKGDIV